MGDTYKSVCEQLRLMLAPPYEENNVAQRLEMAIQAICFEIDDLKEKLNIKQPHILPPSFAKQLILGLSFITGESGVWGGIENGIYLNPNVPNKEYPDKFQIVTAGETLSSDMIKAVNYPLIEEENMTAPEGDSRIYKSYIFQIK